MKKIIEFVNKELAVDNSGHDFEHAKRVANNALNILKYEKANEKIVLTSCYLHDCVDKKLFNNIEEQVEKIKLLLKDEYSEEEINQILDIISTISYNNGNYKDLSTIEACIVRDADRLDAIGSIGIIRTIEYGNSRNRKFYSEENIKNCKGKLIFNKSSETTLSHFYDKLLKLDALMHTKYAKKEAKRRKKILIKFLKEFYLELK